MPGLGLGFGLHRDPNPKLLLLPALPLTPTPTLTLNPTPHLDRKPNLCTSPQPQSYP